MHKKQVQEVTVVEEVRSYKKQVQEDRQHSTSQHRQVAGSISVCPHLDDVLGHVDLVRAQEVKHVHARVVAWERQHRDVEVDAQLNTGAMDRGGGRGGEDKGKGRGGGG